MRVNAYQSDPRRGNHLWLPLDPLEGTKMTEQAQEDIDSTRVIKRPERQLAEGMEELYAVSSQSSNYLMPKLWQSTTGNTHEDWARFYIRLIELITDVEDTLNSGQLEEFRYHTANQLIQDCRNIVVSLPNLTHDQFRSQYETGHLTTLRLIIPDISEEESPLSESGWNEILEDLSTLKNTIRTSTIPDNFKNDLLNTLIDLEKTINDHQYNGTDPIQNNVDRGLGVMIRFLSSPETHWEEVRDIVAKWSNILDRLNVAFYRNQDAIVATADIMKQLGGG